MSAPDIILPRGQVMIQQTTSQLGIVSLDNKYNFGLVIAVSDVSDRYAAGAYVMYEQDKVSKFLYGSTFYFLIDEQYISGEEVLPP